MMLLSGLFSLGPQEFELSDYPNDGGEFVEVSSVAGGGGVRGVSNPRDARLGQEVTPAALPGSPWHRDGLPGTGEVLGVRLKG